MNFRQLGTTRKGPNTPGRRALRVAGKGTGVVVGATAATALIFALGLSGSPDPARACAESGFQTGVATACDQLTEQMWAVKSAPGPDPSGTAGGRLQIIEQNPDLVRALNHEDVGYVASFFGPTGRYIAIKEMYEIRTDPNWKPPS